MSDKYKTVSDLLADIESVGRAADGLDDLAATMFRHPDVAQALTRAVTEDGGGSLAGTPSQRIHAASASLREYRRLLESVADGTRMTWPPAARVTTERTDQKGD